MKELKLKGNIFIKGFDEKEDADVEWGNHMWWDNYRNLENYELIYNGKTSEIKEEEAQKYVNSKGVFYEEYDPNYDEHEFSMLLAKESLHTACQKEYCLIYKWIKGKHHENKTKKAVSNELPNWLDEIDFESMLNKYGPEGCYDIANKLKEVAMKDVGDALRQRTIPEGSCQQPTCVNPFWDSCEGCFWVK